MPDSVTPSRGLRVAAVDRAVDLLEALACHGPSSLAALADATGCTRTLAYRMLRTLELRGFSMQDGARGLWRLGPRNETLGRAATVQGALAAIARPMLAALSIATGENAYLMTREGTLSQIVGVNKADIRLWQHEPVGKTRQLHAGPGRLLLAHAPVAVQRQVLIERLGRLTPQTRIDPAWISDDLQRIRTRGYLLTVDEVNEGSVALAAPVRDQTGEVVAALFIVASSLRLSAARAQSLAPTVRAYGILLSRTLGLENAADEPG